MLGSGWAVVRQIASEKWRAGMGFKRYKEATGGEQLSN